MTWQPIETAPKDGTRILMYRPDSAIQEAWWVEPWIGERGEILHVAAWGGTGWWYPEWHQPTHWMPKPPPPYQGDV